jgi:hypothetical protein
MPTRPDLREITTGVKDALADSDRDALLEMLTFLIKEYVVDGPPPMLVHQTENIADLGRLSFAQLITALQTRLDIPELALFVVDGEQVSVRVGGAMHALTGRGAAAAAAAAARADLPRPAAGVRVVESNLVQQPRPPAPTPGVSVTERPAAPPPSRGLSVSSRAPAPEGGGQSPAPPAPPAAPPQAAPQADKPDTAGGDDASARFSLLELD